MFLAPRFFWERAPRIFGLGLFNPDSFRPCGQVSGRSAEGPRRTRGEIKKRKNHHEHFIRPPVTTVNGRPKEESMSVTNGQTDRQSTTKNNRLLGYARRLTVAFCPVALCPGFMCHARQFRGDNRPVGIARSLKPNTHRRRRRDETVESRRVGGVYWA